MAALPASLLAHVQNVECLNQAADHTIHGMLSGKTTLESDCDEQLILHFRFSQTEPVRAQALRFTAPVGTKAVPKKVNVYLNQSTLLFQSVDSVRPVDTLDLQWSVFAQDPTLQEAVAWLPKAKSQTANHVAVFVSDNATGGDDDVTVLSGMDILGEMAKGQGTMAAPAKG